MTTRELAPGIHEIVSDMGSRSVRQWLCVGDHVALVDTGIVGTVPAAILPALEAVDVERTRVTDVLISHADVDHYGGNAELFGAIPGAISTSADVYAARPAGRVSISPASR